MGKLIAVVSGKGGTGKTTFTASVGLALAAMGRHVLCMDCDITLRNLDLALGLSDSALMDFSDVLSGSCSLADAVTTHPRYQKLDFLPAPLTFREPSYSAAQLLRLAASIRENYDFCLIDAPAGLGTGFRMATDMADSVIVVTTTDVSALRDAQHTVMELDRFPVGRVHLVVNRVQKKLLQPAHHHRRRHRYSGPAPSGGRARGYRRPRLAQPGHPRAGIQLLRRPRVREHCQAHQRHPHTADENLIRKGDLTS